MGSFSIWHWVVVLLIVLLLFGAKRIPELAKGLGSGIKNFKNAIKEDEAEAPKTADAKPAENTQQTSAPQQPNAAHTATATPVQPTTAHQTSEHKPTHTDAHKA